MSTLSHMPAGPDSWIPDMMPPRPPDPRDQAVADARELQQLATAQLAAEREQSARVREFAAEALEHLQVLVDGSAACPGFVSPDLVSNQVRLAIRALSAAAALRDPESAR
jgi:hypothetical protein